MCRSPTQAPSASSTSVQARYLECVTPQQHTRKRAKLWSMKQARLVSRWPGDRTSSKIPSLILYDSSGAPRAHGASALDEGVQVTAKEEGASSVAAVDNSDSSQKLTLSIINRMVNLQALEAFLTPRHRNVSSTSLFRSPYRSSSHHHGVDGLKIAFYYARWRR